MICESFCEVCGVNARVENAAIKESVCLIMSVRQCLFADMCFIMINSSMKFTFPLGRIKIES